FTLWITYRAHYSRRRVNTAVACEQIDVQIFSRGNISGVVSGEVFAQLPHSFQQQRSSYGLNLQLPQMSHRALGCLLAHHVGEKKAPDDLEGFDLQMLGPSYRVSGKRFACGVTLIGGIQ